MDRACRETQPEPPELKKKEKNQGIEWDSIDGFCPHAGSIRGPFAYEANALPLSYKGRPFSPRSDSRMAALGNTRTKRSIRWMEGYQ